MAIQRFTPRWRMRGWLGDYLVVHSRDNEALASGQRVPAVFVASRLEDWLSWSPGVVLEMYEALGGHAPLGMSTLQREHYDRRLQERLADAFHSGELVALSLPRPAWNEPQPRLKAVSREEPAEETAWIGLKLVDKDEKPMAGVRYRLTLASGAVREGMLDTNGTARVEGVKPGSCQISFPDLDSDLWS